MANQDAYQQASSPPQPDLEAIYTHLSRYPFSTDQEYQAGLAAILGHRDTPATSEELREKSDLVLQAQCFYFSRRFNVTPPVSPRAYSAWLQSQPHPHPHLQIFLPPSQPEASASAPPASSAAAGALSSPPQISVQTAAFTSPSTTTAAAPSGPSQDPPYPTSFAAIVDLITRNLPVPGIEEIPPTVLEPGSSKIDKTPRRKKPWEKDVDATPSEKQQPEVKEVTPLEAGDAQATNRSGQSDEARPEPEGIDINGHRPAGEGLVKILQPNAIPDSGLLKRD
ncbi:uncharacterized protein Z519_06701 [Cladophialophora bantiana CBS 173.52]|uniref:Uncharacterized protein n=1 Tax=Cladophialophora bantiana (strain ATCC 10958 / CBS 173.52 / CDC B-1940 / NIH 8579) TaxID=1442370 RepID=A0A0D2G2A7_CLAB1|nr:uncharacterized protein Z519_06701 [Cladophialophora bantiana CBS 173.52]KIW92852.1 hypothetical protein Z519_06701 [Cladophialophora bantiana CBS 173.52]